MKADTDYLKGFMAGRSIAVRLAGLKTEPKLYLYNGTVLPKLPKWDDKTYPYAVIWSDAYSRIVLSVSAEQVVYWDFVGYYYDTEPDVDANRLVYVIQDGNFVLDDGYDKHTNGFSYSTIWTNHNIIDTDSENMERVQLAASDPVPYNGTFQYCLYNGTKMLALPEWDTETYPYALIVAPEEDYYPQKILIVSSKPYYIKRGSWVNNQLYSDAGSDYVCFAYCDTAWAPATSPVLVLNMSYHLYVWSNHNIIDRDGGVGEAGAVYFEGSNPIPVT